jgi:hypothetical protein
MFDDASDDETAADVYGDAPENATVGTDANVDSDGPPPLEADDDGPPPLEDEEGEVVKLMPSLKGEPVGAEEELVTEVIDTSRVRFNDLTGGNLEEVMVAMPAADDDDAFPMLGGIGSGGPPKAEWPITRAPPAWGTGTSAAAANAPTTVSRPCEKAAPTEADVTASAESDGADEPVTVTKEEPFPTRADGTRKSKVGIFSFLMLVYVENV